jgi:Uncharacterised protein family (UPF0228).
MVKTSVIHLNVMDMSKINKETAIIIVFLAVVILYGLFTKEPVDTNKQTQKPEVAGFIIQFEDGTTEPEVKAILENYNMILNYSIDCNWDNGGYKYYIKVNKNNMSDLVKDGLRKDENWTDPVLDPFTKGDFIIYPITEQATHDKNFLTILEKNNLQMKKFVWCLIRFGDGSSNYIQGKNWITEKDATIIKNELEKNEKILTVMVDGISY